MGLLEQSFSRSFPLRRDTQQLVSEQFDRIREKLIQELWLGISTIGRWNGSMTEETLSYGKNGKGYILIQQGVAKTLNKDGKSEKMIDDDGENIEAKCISTIRLFIVNNIINTIIEIDSAPKLGKKFETYISGKAGPQN